MTRIHFFFFLFFVLIISALQGSPYYAHTISIFNVKVNSLILVSALAVLIYPRVPALCFVFLAGYSADMISNTYCGFYIMSFFAGSLPVFFTKSFISEQSIPVFALEVFVCTACKTAAEVILLGIFYPNVSLSLYLKNTALLEIIINTAASVPFFFLFLSLCSLRQFFRR